MHGGVAQMRVERETECGRQRGGSGERVRGAFYEPPLGGVYGGGQSAAGGHPGAVEAHGPVEGNGGHAAAGRLQRANGGPAGQQRASGPAVAWSVGCTK